MLVKQQGTSLYVYHAWYQLHFTETAKRKKITKQKQKYHALNNMAG